jgi:aminoglycoside phosphotransferase (APT) family kinase protein
VLTEQLYDRLLGERARRISRLTGRLETSRAIMSMLDEGRESLVGWEFQPVLYHADLRPKHVQNAPDGSIHGILDWGAYEDFFLPYADLLHIFAHLRHSSARWQWHRLRDRQLSDAEGSILDDYCQSMAIPPERASAIERLYPLLVCGMAERNWEFSRPFWVHREFGL